ncbi:hypothetical protein BN126_1626 [Cronobacter sakazakii 680]|nr:hypothetical protein BN126_1626 [Cronobacter sakazakii 680]
MRSGECGFVLFAGNSFYPHSIAFLTRFHASSRKVMTVNLSAIGTPITILIIEINLCFMQIALALNCTLRPPATFRQFLHQ